jgi:hypothetical protein
MPGHELVIVQLNLYRMRRVMGVIYHLSPNGPIRADSRDCDRSLSHGTVDAAARQALGEEIHATT